MILLWSIFLIYFKYSSGYDKGTHNTQSELQVESFQYGDYFFNFYFVEANWDEALAICKASSSRLAVIHNIERANFLANVLTYTVIGVEDVWIGGRFIGDNWQWVAIKHRLPESSENGFPPWLNHPTERGKYCLSLDRKNHSKPIFVELQCSLQRPFICEKSSPAHLRVKPKLATEVTINSSTYSIYYGRRTWEESLTFCKQIESHLATIPNMQIANQLAIALQHLRPSIRNAWIGARRQNYVWTWASSKHHMPMKTNLERKFPPWANEMLIPEYHTFKDCLVLDYHLCAPTHPKCDDKLHVNDIDKSIFRGENCNLKKDFICETGPKNRKANITEIEPVRVGSNIYIFSKSRKSWIDAVHGCKSLNMVLAMPANKLELDTIVSNLADVEYAWDHIWLGAKWNVLRNQWEFLNKNIIPTSNGSYLPWCTSLPIHHEHENCLNLDRDAHKIPIVYGFNCLEAQGFVCQSVAEEGLPLPESTETRSFLVQDYLLNHADAEEACQVHKSHLAIVNTLALAQNLSVIIPVDSSVWIGGERIESIWHWTKTRETIPDFPDKNNYPPWGNTSIKEEKVCLLLKSGFRRYPQFIEEPCNSKHFYVCELGPESLPQPYKTVRHKDSVYYFFRKPEDWKKANSICSLSRLRLSKIQNLELANFLSEITGDQHQWWVGAKREPTQLEWRWISTEEPVSNAMTSSSWFNTTSTSSSHSECLVLLNGSSTLKFTGKNCAEKHGFICMKSNIMRQRQPTKKHNLTFVLKENLANLQKSKQYCEEQKMKILNITGNIRMAKEIMEEKGRRFSLNSPAILVETIKQIVKEVKQPFLDLEQYPQHIKSLGKPKQGKAAKIERHLELTMEVSKTCVGLKSLWINIVQTKNGKWVYQNTGNEFFTNINFPEKNNIYGKDAKQNCAMLLLKAYNQLEIRRSDCDDYSFILCQKVDSHKQKAPNYRRLDLDNMKFVNTENKIFASLQGKTFRESQTYCDDLGAEMINEDTYIPATRFFQKLQDPFQHFWLDKSYSNKLIEKEMKRNRNDFNTVQFLQSKIDQLCIVYNRFTKMFHKEDCNNYFSTVCFMDLRSCAPPEISKNLIWSPETCTGNNITIGRVCTAICQKGYLFGPERVACLRGTWTFRSSSIELPKCLANINQSHALLKFLISTTDQKSTSRIPFVFAIDNGVSQFVFDLSLSIIKHIVNIVLLDKYRKAAVITYSARAEIVLEFNKYNTCNFIEKLKSLTIHKRRLSTNYFAVLETFQHLLDNNSELDQTILIFFTLRKDTGPVAKRINMLQQLEKRGVIIIVLAVTNGMERSDLEEMASAYSNTLQLYLFRDAISLRRCGNFLKENRKSAVAPCASIMKPRQ